MGFFILLLIVYKSMIQSGLTYYEAKIESNHKHHYFIFMKVAIAFIILQRRHPIHEISVK